MQMPVQMSVLTEAPLPIRRAQAESEPMAEIDLSRTRTVIEHGIEQGLQPGAQLFVALRGETVADLAFGQARSGISMASDTVNLWLSSSKPIAAVAIAQLWERGQLAIDDRVAQHLPEFGTGGKESISLRHLLTHTGGFRGPLNNFTGGSWDEIIARICAMRLEPSWVPGQKAGYHIATSWFILGELIRRIDGRSFDRYVREEIFLPLGMNDCWIGMPAEQFQQYAEDERLGFMHITEKGEPNPDYPGNTLEGNVMPRPGANGRGPIRELGRFYQMLLNGGTLDGARILSPQTVEAITAHQRVGLFDHTFQHLLDWGFGFLVGSNHYGPNVPYGYGEHSSPRTFGHSGSQSSAGFCDPENGLVVAVICNGTPGEAKHQARMRSLYAALYEDLRLTSAD